ncbi:furin [Limosa lapponica baueri]|uniref:Furin n=1 Tax=Limosa lapponica baueri TaxID=1758121 RepID=A0A2I0T3I8_LIMLA|nr:furin [Limosa lapponica baueri]
MDLRPCSLLLLWTLVVALTLLAQEVLAQRIYTNTWAVLVPAGPQEADRLARKHGFLNLGPREPDQCCSGKVRLAPEKRSPHGSASPHWATAYLGVCYPESRVLLPGWAGSPGRKRGAESQRKLHNSWLRCQDLAEQLPAPCGAGKVAPCPAV